MQRIFYYINHRNVALFAILLMLVGMVFSRFLLSIGTIALFGRAILHPGVGRHLKALIRHKDFLALASILALYAVSLLWSDNLEFALDRLRMKLPFVALPLGMLAIKKFDKALLYRYFYFFFWMIVVTSLGSLLYFLTDFSAIADKYAAGQVMATPAHHIRFSLMIVFAICIGIEFFRKKWFLRTRSETMWILAATVFLILFLHVLAVRSGLLALYCVAIFYFILFILKSKKYLTGVVVMVVFAGMSWGSYTYVPTLRKKVDYTIYSYQLFQQNEGIRMLSDSRRLGSLLAGVDLFREHPVFGVGIGDIKDATNMYLKEHHPDLVDLGLMPHNQFLFVLTATGLFGLTWFVWAITWPLIKHQRWKWPLFLGFNIIYWSSFIVEHTLETQVGTAIYLVPLIMMMRASIEKEKHP